jgi:hypothetical protein
VDPLPPATEWRRTAPTAASCCVLEREVQSIWKSPQGVKPLLQFADKIVVVPGDMLQLQVVNEFVIITKSFNILF